MAENADIKELAVAAWRLEKWLGNLNADRKMAAKSALRSIKKYISACGVEVKDPIGAKFDPGLAVEVVNNEAEDVPEDELIIIETLAPYVYQNGELLQYARVIIGSNVKSAKISNENIEDDVKCPEEIETNNGIDSAANTSCTDNEEIKIEASDIERMMAYAKIL